MNPKGRPSGNASLHLYSPSGLCIHLNPNGSIRRMDHQDILLNQFLGTEIEGGPANLYLRRHGPGPSAQTVRLLGPGCPAAFQGKGRRAFGDGEWQAIRYHISLVLAKSAPVWFWHIALQNTGNTAETIDLIHTQDLSLAYYGAVRINTYYTSHYVDHTPLTHAERGFVLASRQNLSMSGRNPWTVIGSLGRGMAYGTDALQFYGLATRAGLAAVGLTDGLPSVRLQHEHAMVSIQDTPVLLAPGATADLGFFGWFEADHPSATTSLDLNFVDRAMSLPEALPPRRSDPRAAGPPPSAGLFSEPRLLESLDLTSSEMRDLFGNELRDEEKKDGRSLSFFTDTHRHVVLKAKELQVLRPHVHIIRTGHRLVPDEAALTSNTAMNGVFHSMVTQGHASINRLVSGTQGYLGFMRANGQRLFVELEGAWRLLDVPSAYEMTPQGCRWIYKQRNGMIAVRSSALTERHELTLSITVLAGGPVRFLVSNHVAINGDDGIDAIPVDYAWSKEGVRVRPGADSEVGRRFPEGSFLLTPLADTVIEQVGRDEILFSDGLSRNQPFICMITAPCVSAGFRITGRLIPEPAEKEPAPDETRFWSQITRHLRIDPPGRSLGSADATRLGEILPWFVHNSLVHYLAPRGPEQYTGGGWGTRDICQGPVELLLSLDHCEPVRDILIRVFTSQNPDGDWPQWFMFFDRERNMRAGDSHGDIVFWPILALARYLLASEDKTFLDQLVPFFHPDGARGAEQASIWDHVERALGVISDRVIPGTRLAAYGHGDWNDSLQPAQPAMAEQLCSTWTVTLHYQALRSLSAALYRLGMKDQGDRMATLAAGVEKDFRRLLIKDEILPGYAYFLESGRIDYLLHPADHATGVSYSLLPMIHAVIADLLTPEEAERHLDLIRSHLLGPDGARLFDRPMEYRGGPQRFFQRAESAAFFGREIGLMYTHAHLRYAEALAHCGDVAGFFLALCQVNPIAIQSIVPSATLRQANCYYSSSDAAFRDRYQAYEEYDRIHKGEIPLDGGWRVYSSGPGIAVRLIVEYFLGLCPWKTRLIIDPVIPPALDGLRVELELRGYRVEVLYRIQGRGCGPTAVELNGEDLPFNRRPNPYRSGAAEISMAEVQEQLHDGLNRMTVFVA